MAIKTILACLTKDTDTDGVLKAACALARRHNAHLIGLHSAEAMFVYPGIAMHIPDSVVEAYGVAQKQQSDAVWAVFDQHTRAEDFVSEWREIRSERDTSVDRIVDCARTADLVLMSDAEGDENATGQIHRIEAVIRDAGRPVLVVPKGFAADALGQSILIGWNGSREAARAAHDALSLLDAGDVAHIIRANDSGHDEMHDDTLTDLANVFARHGVKTTVASKTWDHTSVADALNKVGFERGADMIAIGAFGHSRAYDLIIGAATRGLLRHSDLPVLFSR